MKLTTTQLKQIIQEELAQAVENLPLEEETTECASEDLTVEEGLVDRPAIHDLPETMRPLAKRLVVAQEQLEAAADEALDLDIKDDIRKAVNTIGFILADLQGI